MNKWKLDKKLGIVCLFLYGIFLCFSIMTEFNVFTFVNLPMCRDHWSRWQTVERYFLLTCAIQNTAGVSRTRCTQQSWNISCSLFIGFSSHLSLPSSDPETWKNPASMWRYFFFNINVISKFSFWTVTGILNELAAIWRWARQNWSATIPSFLSYLVED